MVKLPPGLTIIFQVLMGVLLGTVGLIFATPVAACTLILVQMLYVETTLGDSLDLKQEK
jgi:predicted PurR-regulated permease PerM